MKGILIAGGVALLVLGLFLLLAGIIVFFVSRKRASRGVAPQPQYPPQPVPPRPIPPQPAAAAPQRPIPPPPPPPPPAPAPSPAPAPAAPQGEPTMVVTGVGGMGSLQAVSGPLAGQSFPLKMDGYYIGRDRTQSQIVVEHPSVSKRHIWVGIKDGAVTAIDQASTNGTYLNTLGTRIGQVRLSPGDTLILSDDVARFVYKV